MDISIIFFIVLSIYPSTAKLEVKCVCPPGWTSFGNKCYIYPVMNKNWKDAKDFCYNLDHSALLEIVHESEFDFVKKLVESKPDRQIWMGATDAEEEGVWKSEQTKKKIDFLNWLNNQPDNHEENPDRQEDCLALYPKYDYKYNDLYCSYIGEFVCEKRAFCYYTSK